MGTSLRALIIEDSEDDTELLVRSLRRGGYDAAFQRVETREQTEKALDQEGWQIIFCDYSLPHFNGLEALELYQSKGLDMPFIIVSGAIGEDTAVEVMKAGANDYVMKDNLARLTPAVERELREAEIRRERRKSELALRESQARLSEAQALAHIGSYIIDLKSGMVEVSEEALRILQLDRPLTQSQFMDLIHPENREHHLQKFNSLIKNKQESEMDGRIVRRDGSVSWVHVRAAPRADDKGQTYEIFGTIMDITERRQMEESMLASQKMADLGTLAAGVAHEINSPLQVITGTSEVLLENIDKGGAIEPDQLRHKVDMIHRNAWRVAEIVRALLTYARVSIQQFQQDDLNEIVQDGLLLIEHQLKSWSSISIKHELTPDLPSLYCDHNQLIQVLINLLTNACAAMPNGGVITLRTFYDAKKEKLGLQVRDNGTGIPEPIRKRIFDPFFTTKTPGHGTGLGLSIVSGIVKGHKGSIDLQSTPGEGSIFTLYFPTSLKNDEPLIVNEEEGGRYDQG